MQNQLIFRVLLNFIISQAYYLFHNQPQGPRLSYSFPYQLTPQGFASPVSLLQLLAAHIDYGFLTKQF